MRRFMKNGILLTVIVSIMVTTTGCGSNFIKYYLREEPEAAMERYLEEKYDDDVTLVDSGIEDTFNFYWDKVGFWAKFESEKVPGETISVGARLTEDRMHYKFWDDYQGIIHQIEFQKWVEETAKYYFTGDYKVYVYMAGLRDDEDYEVMSMEEYVSDKLHYGICIFVEDMSNGSAVDAMEQMERELSANGFVCDLDLGRNTKPDTDIDELVMKTGSFDPWGLQQIQWLYKERQPLK